MKNCKECIHNDFCNVDGYIDADECKFYKNKADYAEVKHGYWNDNNNIAYECNLCGKSLVIEQGDADMNYCSHCGAKMDGKEEDK